MRVKELRDSGWVIYETLLGSHAYGTNVKGSDKDYIGIYIQPTIDTFANYIPQIADDNNDTVFYEIGRFIELFNKGNPNIIESLFTEEDLVVYKDPIMEEIFTPEVKLAFITKKLSNTFIGFAYSQLKKSKGLNKKINWEDSKITRKDVLDFCYVLLKNEQSTHFKKWLGKNSHKDISLAKVNNFTEVYSMYSTPLSGGLVGEDSNSLQTKDISKGSLHIGYLRFDVNGYSSHCADYKSYQDWLKNRNTIRYEHIKNHGQKYDGKNLLHTIRILNMAKDISDGKGVIVRRPKNEIDYLINIRKGKVDLEEVYTYAESKIESIKLNFLHSNLPDKVERSFLDKLITKIRIDNI